MIDFEKIYREHGDEEFLEHARIAPDRRFCKRLDLDAFMRLDALLPGTADIIVHSEHDEIQLGIDVDELNKVATEEDALDLIRCGVRYGGHGGLEMFV